MITQMKKYTFLVYHREYNDFLTALRDAGVIHVSDKGEATEEDERLQQLISRSAQIRKTIATAEALLPEGVVPRNAEGNAVSLDDIDSVIADLAALQAEKQKLEQSLAEVQKEHDRMSAWGAFSKEKINALKDAGYELRYFTCPKKSFKAEWETTGSVFPVAEQGGTVYFAVVNEVPSDIELTAEEHHLNEHNALQLKADAEGLRGLIVAKQAALEGWAVSNIGALKETEHNLLRDLDWEKVTKATTAVADNKLCLLEGFCPVDNTADLNKMLEEKHIWYTAADPTEEDCAPVKLHNNRFSKLFEVFTGMYGWPVYGEFDPTPILAPFYLLFFSMCMGDAGYGILLIAFGLLVYYKKLNIEMFEGLGPIITTLGVGTLVVGFFLGTAFGMDLSALFPSIDYLFLNGKVVTEGGVQYLSKAAYAASGMEGGYDVAMVLALLIGVFHICLAMVIKALCYTKRFGFRAQLGTWGWTLLIVGGIAALIVCMALSVPMEVTKIVLIVIAAISALGIYIFNTPGRNPLVNIGAGLWDTYNMATGILGDTLSYIRLYALGLAGGMLGGAFNNLGLMVMGGSTEGATWQWLPFIVILIIGHLLNLAMSALGAFVHPLRLTFVEYFKNSGYEGRGNLYKPFAK